MYLSERLEREPHPIVDHVLPNKQGRDRMHGMR